VREREREIEREEREKERFSGSIPQLKLTAG